MAEEELKYYHCQEFSKAKKSAPLMRNRIVWGSGFLTTCLTTYRTGLHGNKRVKAHILIILVYWKNLKGAEITQNW